LIDFLFLEVSVMNTKSIFGQLTYESNVG
jgi:hypothetical protein